MFLHHFNVTNVSFERWGKFYEITSHVTRCLRFSSNNNIEGSSTMPEIKFRLRNGNRAEFARYNELACGFLSSNRSAGT